VREFFRRTRVRLSLAYGGALSVVAILLAVGFWLGYARLEMARVDDSLSSQSQILLTGIDTQGGRITFQGADTLPGETSEGIAIRAVLLDSGGRVLDRSGSGVNDQAMAQAAAAALAKGPGQPQTMTVSGVHQRVLAQRVGLGSLGNGTLVLARPVNELEQSLAVAGFLLAGIVVVLVAVATGAGYLLAARALQPVHVIASTARELSEQSLHRRIDLQLPPDELGELVNTFNQMLARLETSFESLRRFTADAAHELRAPLTLVRAEAEVALSGTRTNEELRESIQSLLEEVERLSRTADQLLLLARADAGALAARREPVDLPDLIEETVDRWRTLAAGKAVELGVDAAGAAVVDGDVDLLRRLLDNLIDNAVRHSPPGGMVTVALADAGGEGWRLTVSDSGPGVDPDLRDHIFERFTRADLARQRETGGAGLGLALCAAIAHAHGGSIRVETADTGGARFVVDLPQRDRAEFIPISRADPNLGSRSGE
jgi:heavy metal sensor kinase